MQEASNLFPCDCTACVIKSLYFRNIDNEEIASVCSDKMQLKFRKGDLVFQEGEKLEYFAYLKSGLLKYYHILDNGKNQILSIVQPYDTISLLTVFNDNKSLYNVSALEDSTLCYIPIKQIAHFVKTNGAFALDFLMKLSEASNSLLAKQLLMNSKNLSGRVAFVLLQFATEIYKKNSFELPISRREIADMIGMTSENVIRAMSEFKKDNIINMSGKQVHILNTQRLKQIAHYG